MTVVHERCPKVVVSGTFNGMPVFDSLVHRWFECHNCHRTFMERLSWLGPYQRPTESGRTALLYAAVDGTFQAVGEDFGRNCQNVKIHVRRYCNTVQTDDLG